MHENSIQQLNKRLRAEKNEKREKNKIKLKGQKKKKITNRTYETKLNQLLDIGVYSNGPRERDSQPICEKRLKVFSHCRRLILHRWIWWIRNSAISTIITTTMANDEKLNEKKSNTHTLTAWIVQRRELKFKKNTQNGCTKIKCIFYNRYARATKYAYIFSTGGVTECKPCPYSW